MNFTTGSTEFNLSKFEDVTHGFPGTDNILGGGHSLVFRMRHINILDIFASHRISLNMT